MVAGAAPAWRRATRRGAGDGEAAAAESGAEERRAPAMALAAARAAGAGEGSGGRRDAGGGRRGPGGGAEGPRRALRAGGGEEVRLPHGGTGVVGGAGGRVRSGGGHVRRWLGVFFLARVSDGGRRDPNGGGINRHRGS